MAGRPVAFEVSSTSGFEAKNQKISLWLLSGVITTATGVISSGMRLLVYLRGLIITSFDFIIGGLTAVSPVRLLSDLWQFTQTWTVGGTITSSTAVTGAVSRIAASVIRYLGGTIICTTGGLYYLIAWLLGGTVACSTTVIGGLSGIGSKLLAGAIDCATSIVNSGLRLYMGLRGSVSAASSLVGRFLLKISLRGAVSATTSVLGRVTLAMIMGGVVRSATTVIGRVTGTSRRLISGVVTCGTAIISQLVLVLHFKGAIASTTSIIFNLFKGAQHQFLSGLIICGPNPYFVEEYFDDYFANFSAFSGNLKLGFRLGGTVTIVTRLVSEGIRLFLHLAGAIASGTVVIIGLTGIATWLVSGVIVCTTTVISGLTGITTWFVGGVITCATAVTSRLRLTLHQAGTIRISTVVSMGSLSIVKFLRGVIASVTSIFGTPGEGGASYWGITGVTEPQHLWPFFQTGDYSDQGSTGGLTLTAQGSGNSFDGDGLHLDGSGYATVANDADLCDLSGGIYSIILEYTLQDLASYYTVAGFYAADQAWICYGSFSDRYLDIRQGPGGDLATNTRTINAGILVQVIVVAQGGANDQTIYLNGSPIKTGFNNTYPGANSTSSFDVGHALGGGNNFIGTIRRVGVLKGTAWSATDVQNIWASISRDIGPHSMTSDSLPSPYVASASSESFGRGAYLAFDGYQASPDYWQGDQSATEYLKLDLGSGNTKKLYSYGISPFVVNRAPKAWTMLGSNDNSNWDTLDTRSNQTGWTACVAKTYVCATYTTAYRYFKLNITENNGDATYTEINELFLWSGTEISGPAIGVNIIIRVLLSSIIACATSVVGRLKLRMLLSGIIASGTAVLGGITRIGVEVIEYLSGVIASGTSMLAALRLYMKLSGIIQSTTAVLGRLIEYLHLGGIISSVTSIFGNITIRKLLSSLIVVSTSIASAGVRLYMHLSGAVASVTRLTGALLRRISLAGTAVCSTLVSAALRLYMHLSGIITSTTSVLANLTRIGRQFVSGVIICTITVLGGVTRIGVAVIEYLSGVIASGTSVVSNLQRFATWLLGGVIVTVTAVTASAFISRLLSGVITCATTVTGALVKVWTLAGDILSNTAVLGNLTQFFARYLSGTIAISTSIIGNVINVGRKLIGGVIVCGTYVYMGFLSGFSSAGALGRRFIDGVHKMYIKAKQRLKIEP